MKILLLGKYGQLGWELYRTLVSLGEVIALDYPEIDLSRPGSIAPVIAETRPQLIINASAYTAVDRAESESETAFAINAQAPGRIAAAAVDIGAGMIHYSTDYVFDGVKDAPYVESDQPNPLNAYGRSKLAGEEAALVSGAPVLVLRTSWVYSLRKPSFVTKLLAWARQNETLRIVDDQIGSPTWARSLAEVTALLLAKYSDDPIAMLTQHRGVYHLGGIGAVSRYEWARAIIDASPQQDALRVRQILPVKTSEFPTPATRPLNTALDCGLFEKTFGIRLPDWKLALKLSLENYGA